MNRRKFLQSIAAAGLSPFLPATLAVDDDTITLQAGAWLLEFAVTGPVADRNQYVSVPVALVRVSA